jgi:hypothetical protein
VPAVPERQKRSGYLLPQQWRTDLLSRGLWFMDTKYAILIHKREHATALLCSRTGLACFKYCSPYLSLSWNFTG